MTRQEKIDRLQDALNEAEVVHVHDSGLIGVWYGSNTVNVYNTDFENVFVFNFGMLPANDDMAEEQIKERINNYIDEKRGKHL